MLNYAGDFKRAFNLDLSGSNGVAENKTQSKSKNVGKVKLTPFSEIEPEDVTWLWDQRIALGKLTIVAGEPGLGRTFAILDMAARLSKGEPFTNEESGESGEIIFIGYEDRTGDTLRPRLDAAGADVSRIAYLDGVMVKTKSKCLRYSTTSEKWRTWSR